MPSSFLENSFYSFIPELLIVSITLLCVKRKTIIGGIISKTEIAIELPDRAIPPAATELITYGSVFSCSLNIVPLGTTDHIP